MAHFAGTGPEGTQCRQCVYWDFYAKEHWQQAAAKCEMHKRLTKGRLKKGSVPPVPAGTRSCKYFEPRPVR